MPPKRHPKKEVNEAILYAESQGWRVEVGGSHGYGKLYCPYNDKSCRGGKRCRVSIWSTPKSPGNHARRLKEVVDNCTAAQKADNI